MFNLKSSEVMHIAQPVKARPQLVHCAGLSAARSVAKDSGDVRVTALHPSFLFHLHQKSLPGGEEKGVGGEEKGEGGEEREVGWVM